MLFAVTNKVHPAYQDSSMRRDMAQISCTEEGVSFRLAAVDLVADSLCAMLEFQLPLRKIFDVQWLVACASQR